MVHFYNQRGTAEQWIKERKAATDWTRFSCYRCRAKAVRLRLRDFALSTTGKQLMRKIERRGVDLGAVARGHATPPARGSK